jgi:trimeric autotransporter adhesin
MVRAALFLALSVVGIVQAQDRKAQPILRVGDGGPAVNAEINGPSGLAVYGDKYLYVIEEAGGGNLIRRVDLKSGIISTLQLAEHLEAIDSLTLSSTGDLIVTEFTAERVKRIHPSDGSVTVVAGVGRIGFGGDGGPAVSAQMSRPTGTAFDANGNLFIVDMGNDRIRRVDARTAIISTVAGRGVRGSTGDGGPAQEAALEYPNSIAIDRAGNFCIAQYGYGPDSHRIRCVNATTGIIETIAGRGKAGLRGDGGSAVDASLRSPSHIVLDAAGNLIVVDPVNDRVRCIEAKTQIITTIAGTLKGFGGDDGPAVKAKLSNPSGVAFDSDGNLYIAEFVNNRVRRVDAKTGIITTIAGNGLPHRIDILAILTRDYLYADRATPVGQ